MKKICLSLLILIVCLGVGLLGAGAVEAAYFTLSPASASHSVGEQFDVVVGIESGTDKVYAADIWAFFDASKLEIVSIVKAFESEDLPNIIVASKNFDNNAGTITASIQNQSTSSHETAVMTNQPILKITFKAKATGVASFNYTCSAGSTNDCNILSADSYDDVIVCSSNQSGSYTIQAGTGGAVATTAPVTTTTSELPQTGMVEYTVGFLVLAVALLVISTFLFV